MMTLQYLGGLTTGAIVPSLGLALASALPRIEADIALQQALVAQLNLVPPTISGSLTLATEIVTAINASIALGVQVPSLAIQVNAALALIALLNAELGALGFDMSAAGIHAYAFDGRTDELGPALPASLPGGLPSDHCTALVLATAIPASWVALGRLLKTSV